MSEPVNIVKALDDHGPDCVAALDAEIARRTTELAALCQRRAALHALLQVRAAFAGEMT